MSSMNSLRKTVEDASFNNLDAVPGSQEYKFDNLKILKTEENFLGMGAYGAVYKAQCDELPCAAKILHLVHIPMKVGDAGT